MDGVLKNNGKKIGRARMMMMVMIPPPPMPSTVVFLCQADSQSFFPQAVAGTEGKWREKRLFPFEWDVPRPNP